MLQEWIRVLKPGGILVLELPCMDKVFTYIANAINNKVPLANFMSWFPLWGDPKYRDPHMVHRWGYTIAMIQDLLAHSGLCDVQSETPRYHFPNRDMRVFGRKPSTT